MYKLLFIDTETGGLDPSRHSILSLGAVVWEDGNVVDFFEEFVLEEKLEIDEVAMQINQIDIDWLYEHGLPPVDVVRKFHAFLEKNFKDFEIKERISIAGHNVGFDVAFLRRLYRLTDLDFGKFFSHRLLDTASIIKFLTLVGKISLPQASSGEAFERFGIKFEDRSRHTALGDAMATALLLNKLMAMVKTVNRT